MFAIARTNGHMLWITCALVLAATLGRCGAAADEHSASVSAEQLIKTTRAIVERLDRLAPEHSGDDGHERRFATDTRTEQLVREAAALAANGSEDAAPAAFLLAIAIAIDSRGSIQRIPLFGRIAAEVRTDRAGEHRNRNAQPYTLLGREDLALHFFVSSFLAARAGSSAAHAAGLAKELRDAEGGSGFSFADLAADRAGVRFAEEVLAKRTGLPAIAQQFTIEKYMPSIEGLEEGLPLADFESRYGTTSDKRFITMLEEIDRRIANLYSP